MSTVQLTQREIVNPQRSPSLQGDALQGDAQSVEEQIRGYTKFFNELAKSEAIFRSFRDAVPGRTTVESKVVGSLWYHLSEAIVDVLCIALANLESPRIRHLVAQTVYEELGEDSEEKIHTDLLREMLLRAGVTADDILGWSGHEAVGRTIQSLKDDLANYSSDAEISGMLLGMEIVAYQNIDNLIDYVSFSTEVRAEVDATEWAVLHHQLEDGHIRRAVSVFIQHVPDFSNQRRFVRAFTRTIRFWEQFWGEIAAAIHAVHASQATLG